MRKAIGILLALLLALSCAAVAGAETGYRAVISDRADLLTDEEEAKANEAMAPITEYCNVGLYTYSGMSSTDVLRKAELWGQEQFGSQDFTVFIIDMSTRRIGIYSTRNIKRSITTQQANTITDNVYRLATQKRYGDCAAEAFRQMNATLKGDKVAAPMRYFSNALVAIVAAILIAYLLISTRMKQEEDVSLPDIIKVTAIGAGTATVARILTRTVRHERSSGGGGGGGFSGGGGGGGGGGSHGF